MSNTEQRPLHSSLRGMPSNPIYYQIGSGRSRHQEESKAVVDYVRHIKEGLYATCKTFGTKTDVSINIKEVDIFNKGGWNEIGWAVSVIPFIRTTLDEVAIRKMALSFAVKLYDVTHRLPIVIAAQTLYDLTEKEIEEIRTSDYYID